MVTELRQHRFDGKCKFHPVCAVQADRKPFQHWSESQVAQLQQETIAICEGQFSEVFSLVPRQTKTEHCQGAVQIMLGSAGIPRFQQKLACKGAHRLSPPSVAPLATPRLEVCAE